MQLYSKLITLPFSQYGKSAVKRLLRQIGYEVHPVPEDPALLTVKEKEFYTQWTMPYRLENNRYSFVHVDVDLYQSTLDCCEYFYTRLVPGGIMLFDEYGFPSARGEKDAVDEFFSDKPESPIALPTGQGMVLKVPRLHC